MTFCEILYLQIGFIDNDDDDDDEEEDDDEYIKFQAYLKGIVRETRVDHFIHWEYTKGIEERLNSSNAKVVKWFEYKDVEIDGLKARVDAQEKELEELWTRLAWAEQFVELFMKPAPEGKIFIIIAGCQI